MVSLFIPISEIVNSHIYPLFKGYLHCFSTNILNPHYAIDDGFLPMETSLELPCFWLSLLMITEFGAVDCNQSLPARISIEY